MLGRPCGCHSGERLPDGQALCAIRLQPSETLHNCAARMTYLRRPPRIIRLTEGVAAAPLSVVIDQLTEGRKAIWH